MSNTNKRRNNDDSSCAMQINTEKGTDSRSSFASSLSFSTTSSLQHTCCSDINTNSSTSRMLLNGDTATTDGDDQEDLIRSIFNDNTNNNEKNNSTKTTNGEISSVMLQQLAKSCFEKKDSSTNSDDHGSFTSNDNQHLSNIHNILIAHGIDLDILKLKDVKDDNDNSSFASSYKNRSFISQLSSKKKEELLEIAVNILLKDSYNHSLPSSVLSSTINNNHHQQVRSDLYDNDMGESGITILSSRMSTNDDFYFEKKQQQSSNDDKEQLNYNNNNKKSELEHKHSQHPPLQLPSASYRSIPKILIFILFFLITITAIIYVITVKLPMYNHKLSSLREENIRLTLENENMKLLYDQQQKTQLQQQQQLLYESPTQKTTTTSLGKKCWIQLKLGMEFGQCALDTTKTIKRNIYWFQENILFWWNDHTTTSTHTTSHLERAIIENMYYTKEYMKHILRRTTATNASNNRSAVAQNDNDEKCILLEHISHGIQYVTKKITSLKI